MGLAATRRTRTASVLAASAVVVALVVAGIVVVARAPSGGAAAPSSLTLSPSNGPIRGGTIVTIVGAGLGGTSAVHFGHRSARFTLESSDGLRVVAPGGLGVVSVGVSGSSGPAVLAGHYTYLRRPTVRSVLPNLGDARGGTRVLVHGSGFVQGTVVLVGSKPARSVVVRNAGTLVAVVPSGFGRTSLRVVTPGGTSRVNGAARFTYTTTVLVIGDSLGIDLGWGFASDDRALHVTDDAVGSTGLVRQDFYDWPAHLRADLRAVRPTVVVALFGANDNQPIETSHGLAPVGSTAWGAAYRARVRQLRSIAAASGALLAWVGLPRVGPNADVPETFVGTVGRLGRSAMAGDPSGLFVDTEGLFTTGSGAYTPYVRLGPGLVERGHQPDGLHLTPAGATAVDDLVVEALTVRLRSA